MYLKCIKMGDSIGVLLRKDKLNKIAVEGGDLIKCKVLHTDCIPFISRLVNFNNTYCFVTIPRHFRVYYGFGIGSYIELGVSQ